MDENLIGGIQDTFTRPGVDFPLSLPFPQLNGGFPMANTSDRYYTVNEVALIFDVHPNTVRNEILRGTLGFIRVGRKVRIPQSALDAYLAQPSRTASVMAS